MKSELVFSKNKVVVRMGIIALKNVTIFRRVICLIISVLNLPKIISNII